MTMFLASSMLASPGVECEDACLVLFPTTLESCAKKRYSQFPFGHFANSTSLCISFLANLQACVFYDLIVQELNNLEMGGHGYVFELVTHAPHPVYAGR